MMVFDSDDFGANHVISDMCQAHDCRDILDKLHLLNPAFKATLFAIPGEMTQEMLNWCKANSSWIQLAVHGFYHTSNYECEKMTYEEFADHMEEFYDMFEDYFVKGFKAPGWQISNACYEWLHDHDWWVADKNYNNERRPRGLPAYVNYDGNDMKVCYNGAESEYIPATHHHTWDVGWNGVYEQFDQIVDLIRDESNFSFISEVIDEETQANSGEIRSGG